MEIDVFIPAHAKDFPVLSAAIRSIRTHVTPRACSITVIAKAQAPDLDRVLADTGAQFVDEDEILSPFQRAQMPPIIVNGEDRAGWYFQQLLKWGVAKRSEHEHYLVSDGDTIFIRPTPFLEGDRVVFYRGTQHHRPYFQTYKKLLGEAPGRQRSFIANFMMLNRAMVQELISAIERGKNKPWYEVVLEAIDRKTVSSFSEYETYGYYMSRRHPEGFVSRRHSCLNLRSRMFRHHPWIAAPARRLFYAIAYHNYSR